MTHTKIASLVVLGAIAAAPLAATAQTRPYGDGRAYDGGYHERYAAQSSTGVIASANRGDITLRNGRTIYLKAGTVIDPRGRSLQAGQRIAVRGSDAGNGNINAQAIRILDDARYGNGNYDSDDRNGARGRRSSDRDGNDRNGNDRDNRENHVNGDDRDNR